MNKLTEKEFEELTNTWIERLGNAMSTSGCNDVFPDEFPQTVCDKINSDFEVLEEWEKMFFEKTKKRDNLCPNCQVNYKLGRSDESLLVEDEYIKKPKTHAELQELIQSMDFVEGFSDEYNDNICAYEINFVIEC